jgi:hypothetical protein
VAEPATIDARNKFELGVKRSTILNFGGVAPEWARAFDKKFAGFGPPA